MDFVRANREDSENEESEAELISRILIDAALSLAVADIDLSAPTEFSELLSQLLEVYPPSGKLMERSVRHLTQELPIEEVNVFGNLLVRLRAE